MGKTKFGWWVDAKDIGRSWPELKREYEDLHTSSLAVNISGMPTSGNISRTTENIALRTMPGEKQTQYDACVFALSEIRRIWGKDGEKLIRMVLWNKKQRFTIEGAGNKIGFSERTARRIHWRFILAIGKGMDWISRGKYIQEIKRENN